MLGLTMCRSAVLASVLVGATSGAIHAQPFDPAVFVDESTFAVVRVDPGRVDPAAAMATMLAAVRNKATPEQKEALGEVEGQWRAGAASMSGMLKSFGEVGGREVHVFFSFDGLAVRPLLVARVEGGNSDAVAEMLRQAPGLNDPEMTVAKRQGMVLIGPAGRIAGVPVAAATRAEELRTAMSAAGNAPIAVALIPPDFIRRAFEEMSATLPPELGGKPVTVVTRGVHWAGLGLALPPAGSLNLVVQSQSTEAAAELAQLLETIKVLDARIGDEAQVAALRATYPLLTPKVQGDRLVLAVDRTGVEELSGLIVPSLIRAREVARGAVVASNLRQVCMGLIVWANDHKEEFPPDLKSLVPKYLAPEMLTHPGRPGDPDPFAYIRPAMNQFLSHHIVLHEKFTDWPRDGIWVAFADGHVQLVGAKAEFDDFMVRTVAGNRKAADEAK